MHAQIKAQAQAKHALFLAHKITQCGNIAPAVLTQHL